MVHAEDDDAEDAIIEDAEDANIEERLATDYGFFIPGRPRNPRPGAHWHGPAAPGT